MLKTPSEQLFYNHPVFCLFQIKKFRFSEIQLIYDGHRDGRTDRYTLFKRCEDASNEIVQIGPKRGCSHETSTAGVHQMRLLRCWSLMIVSIFVVIVVFVVAVVFVVDVVVSHLKSLHPQNPQFLWFRNNTGPTEGWTDGQLNGQTDTISY